MNRDAHQKAPFGSILTDLMAVASYRDGAWGKHEILPTGTMDVHPAAHALHYGSSCFEGFKAYRRADGQVHIFRMDRHIARLQQSAHALVMPEPGARQVGPAAWGLCRSAPDLLRLGDAPVVIPVGILAR